MAAPVEELVSPRYGEAALTDLVPSVLAVLGRATAVNTLQLPPARRYVLLLVDGLGWHLLRRHAADAPYLAGLAAGGRAITVGVPSTTATSLTGLGTGLPPGAHGVVGYTCAVPGTDRLLNALRWDTSVEPRSWQPHRTAFERAGDHGITVTRVGPRAFRGSGITVAGLRGGRYVEADSVGQSVDRIATAVADLGTRPGLVYGYDGALDWTGHRDGCESAAWAHQLAAVDGLCARLRSALPADAVLVVTGDHGMVDVPFDRRSDADTDAALRAGVRVVGGEARFRHVYTRAGAAADVATAWRERLAPEVVVLTREEAVARGWFGPVEARVAPRLGDVVAACVGPTAVECSHAFPKETGLVGLHGSLTAQEMLVPLLIDGRC